MINGVSRGFIESSRGLRQGEPCPLVIFILVMEALSCILKKASRSGLVRDFSAGAREGLIMCPTFLFPSFVA